MESHRHVTFRNGSLSINPSVSSDKDSPVSVPSERDDVTPAQVVPVQSVDDFCPGDVIDKSFLDDDVKPAKTTTKDDAESDRFITSSFFQ